MLKSAEQHPGLYLVEIDTLRILMADSQIFSIGREYKRATFVKATEFISSEGIPDCGFVHKTATCGNVPAAIGIGNCNLPLIDKGSYRITTGGYVPQPRHSSSFRGEPVFAVRSKCTVL